MIRQLLLATLLLFALPAFAVDTDGDGVDDSLDAFPNHIEASVDTDGDGMPDSFTIPVPELFNGTTLNASWQKSGWYKINLGRLEFGPGGGSIWKTVTTGTYVSFEWSKGQIAQSTFSFYVDNVAQSCPSSPCSVALAPGVHTLKWSGNFACQFTICQHDTPPWTDNINFGFVPSLTEDSDDDNDGVADVSDKFPLNAAASSDTDNDGYPGSWNATCDATCQMNSGLLLDNCPSNANADQLNTDGDSQGNACDSDDDNDGVPDASDAFPLDTDNDGLDNNADPDDDNDGLPDVMDPLPLQVKFNRDANYQGSRIGEGARVQ